ncbi:probable ADK2-adenylate kinase, mitochondrial [Sporisorium reilianum f. sp. reilianum]|uniref:Probable ADK2-adenylate kinase, mitochondrial n=1 Tax=Sporisorium reilianum f. sp. reilianum TaxID=72559 RepID=A0A2N8UD17_9BASI|nr:probable ADK2-adenylate kinase, mitochondrial [Sporisorium reilianum f. sp. reilianum]
MASTIAFRSFRIHACSSSTRTLGSIRRFTASHHAHQASTADTQLRMLIVGSPGSGKGTQSTRLLKHYKFSVLSAGDVLRSHIQRGTEIGQRADAVIKQGALMPDAVMMDLIGAEVKTLAESDWLLDGFPRTLGQAEMLDAMLEAQGKPLQLVVNLDVPEEVILDRILQRWTHLPSGRVYNLSYNPPRVEGKDDVTGEPLSKREDDNVDTFAKRLKSFYNQTEPMLHHYRSKSRSIIDIDCRTSDAKDTPTDGAQLFVNLKGDTSNQIWPHLLKIVHARFPNLQQA